MEQARLVELAQRGDHAAFSTLVSSFGPALFGVALRIAGDPDVADDAVQETIITAWRELPRLRQPERIKPWLMKIVVRKCSRLVRSRTSGTRIAILPVSASTMSGVDDLGERDEMERAFARMSQSHREVLVLRYYLDLETQDIASILDVPPGTVRSRLHYALDALRAALAADGRTSRTVRR